MCYVNICKSWSSIGPTLRRQTGEEQSSELAALPGYWNDSRWHNSSKRWDVFVKIGRICSCSTTSELQTQGGFEHQAVTIFRLIAQYFKNKSLSDITEEWQHIMCYTCWWNRNIMINPVGTMLNKLASRHSRGKMKGKVPESFAPLSSGLLIVVTTLSKTHSLCKYSAINHSNLMVPCGRFWCIAMHFRTLH